MGIEEQPSNAEIELQKKILEIGNVMDKILLEPFVFSDLPTNTKTNEETVCRLIADVLQHRMCLADDGGYDGIRKIGIEKVLATELLKKNRNIDERLTTSKKLVLWLVGDSNFCCDIDPVIRQEVQNFLKNAYMSKELSTTSNEERQRMWKEAEQEFKSLSPEKRNKIIRESEQEERWRNEISDLKWSEELKKNMNNDIV
jgi:hypothetical protein